MQLYDGLVWNWEKLYQLEAVWEKKVDLRLFRRFREQKWQLSNFVLAGARGEGQEESLKVTEARGEGQDVWQGR